MTTVILVGERQTILEILGAALAREGISIRVASNRNELELLLKATQPDIVLFDHIQPTDLYDLNPRPLGFEGPLVLVSDADENATARRVLETDHVVRGHMLTELVLSIRTLVGGGSLAGRLP